MCTWSIGDTLLITSVFKMILALVIVIYFLLLFSFFFSCHHLFILGAAKYELNLWGMISFSLVLPDSPVLISEAQLDIWLYVAWPSCTFLVSLALVTKPKRLNPRVRMKCRILLHLGPHPLYWQLREGDQVIIPRWHFLHHSRFPNPFLLPPADSLVHGNCPALTATKHPDCLVNF